MKKRILAIILAILTLVPFAMPVNAADRMLGDVDGDGKITAADARLALRASVSLEKLDAEAFTAADADKDTKISASDARLILRGSVGLERLGRDYYIMREKWTEAGKWEFTFTDIKTHENCISVPEGYKVYTVQYKYKNLGISKKINFDAIFNLEAYDESGTELEFEYCSHEDKAIIAAIGEEETATVNYIVKNDCKEIKILVEHDENGNSSFGVTKRSAEFRIDTAFKCSHKWVAPTCYDSGYCSLCLEQREAALGHTAGANKYCVRCNCWVGDIYPLLGAPLDTMASIKAFLPQYYSRYCYYVGNYRLLRNTADGMILTWGAQNKSNKTIKYITAELYLYNRVGDPAHDEFTGKTTDSFQIIGPIEPGKRFFMRHLFCYSTDLAYVTMGNVTIEYMDGTKVTDWYGYKTSGTPSAMDGDEYLYIED